MLPVQTKHHVALKEWIPLSRAVFAWAFGNASKSNPANTKPISELTDQEIAESAKTPLSKSELEEVLKEKTRADQVSINETDATFRFGFHTGHGAIVSGGPPWALLKPLPAEFVEPWEEVVELSAVVKSGQLVRIESDDPSRDNLIRQAVGLVWRQLMLRPFDHAIASGDLALYARPQSVSQEFTVLPPDIWPVLAIVDWEKGVASAPDGAIYCSIHADLAPSTRIAVSAGGAVIDSGKRGWKRRSAKLALEALYPDGVPADVPSKVLCKAVAEWRKAAQGGEFEINEITVLRAAGRKP
jgi:hypothetical protein